MELACVIDKCLATPPRPDRAGGLRSGRADLADPVELAEETESTIRALEELGAAVESERAGEIFFALNGLRGLYGGSSAGVLVAARRAVGEEKAIGTGTTRFAAFLAATAWPRPVSVEALRTRLGVSEREAGELIEALERLGIGTLREFVRLSADQVADRFGPLGLRALRLCHGEEEPLRPRIPHEELVEEIELPEGTVGRQLDRALELLVDRLLALPQRRGGRCSVSAWARASPPAAAGASSRASAVPALPRRSCATSSSRASRSCRGPRASCGCGEWDLDRRRVTRWSSRWEGRSRAVGASEQRCERCAPSRGPRRC